MKKSYCFFVCSLLTICVSAQLITKTPKPLRSSAVVKNEVTRAYNWWKYVNPTNVNYFATFTNINPVNYDTGVINFSKRTAISLVGWVNPNVDRSIAISDDSLVHLEPLVYLEQLLISTNIGDAGIMHLRGLKNLRHFEIAVAGVPAYNITDESMSVLGELENIEILRLYFCSKVSDVGLQKLTKLSKLKELGLNGCGITDKGLSNLSEFANLETLSIAATSITDEGAAIIIRQLPSLPALKRIIISNSKIRQKGKDELIRARKGLSIIY